MFKVLEVFWNGIGQAPFKIVPDKLIRVKFRRVSGETVGMKPRMFTEEFSDRGSFMGSAAVPEKDHMAAQVSEQLTEELNHLRGSDVLIGMEPGIESHALAFWRNAESRDGRNLLPPSCDAQNWSLSSDSPGSDHVRDHKESAFVEENQVSLKSFGVFLYGATHIASNAESLPRPARGLGSPAFGSSNPFPPKTATSGWGDSLSQTDARSLSLLDAGSKDRLNTHTSALPSQEFGSAPVSGPCPIWEAFRERLSNPKLWILSSDSLPTSEKPNSRNSPSSWTRPADFSISSSTGRLAGAAPPAAFGFHRVSCPIEYDKLSMFSISYA